MSTLTSIEPASVPNTRVAKGSGRAGWLVAFLLLAGFFLYVLYSTGAFAPKLKIAIITSGDGPYWDRVIAGAKDAADQLDVELKIERLKTDAQLQSDTIEKLINNDKWDGVAVSPISLTRQSLVLGRVAAVTTLVTLDSDVPVSRRLCFVGTDNYSAGRQMGEQIRRALPEGGDIIVSIGQPDKENTLRRRQGLIDDLCDRTTEPMRPFDPLEGPQAGSKYRVVATLVDYSDPAKATELATAALAKYPTVKCLAGTLSYSAGSLVAAVDKSNAGGRVKVVGFDVPEDTLKMIDQEKVYSTTIQDQYGLGFNAVRILADNARHNIGGLPMFQQHTLGCETVTKENVDRVRQRLSGQQVSITMLPASGPVDDENVEQP